MRLHGDPAPAERTIATRASAPAKAIPAAWRGDIAAARPLAATPTPSDQNKTRPATVAECIAASLPAQHPLAVYEQLLEAWRTDVAVMQ